jgi:hypothetical protein
MKEISARAAPGLNITAVRWFALATRFHGCRFEQRPNVGAAPAARLTDDAAAGASGVILKDVALEILVQSLRQVVDGQRLLPLPSRIRPCLGSKGTSRTRRTYCRC